MPTDPVLAMETFIALLFLAAMAGLWAVLRWVRGVPVHDATVLIPRSMPCLAGGAHRRPSDNWTDEDLDRVAKALGSDLSDDDIDRMADALESDDGDLEGAVHHFERRSFLTGRDPGDEHEGADV